MDIAEAAKEVKRMYYEIDIAREGDKNLDDYYMAVVIMKLVGFLRERTGKSIIEIIKEGPMDVR